VDEITNPIAIRGTGIEHGLNFRAIHEAHGRAGGVQDEVVKQIAGELAWVGGEEAFDVVDVVEGVAAGEFAGGIDG
jgi:hypothetical protein